MKKLINLLSYGKHNKKIYDKYKKYINKNNLKSLEVLCAINLIVCIMLFIILHYINLIPEEFVHYLFINIFVSSAGIIILKRDIKINSVVVIISYYLYIIITMTIYKIIAVNNGITALIPLIGVVYAAASFLFIDKPIRYNSIMALFAAGLYFIGEKYKLPIIDYFVYFVIYVIGVIISYFNFDSILSSSKTFNKIKKERDLDMLTKLYNRGASERIISELLLSEPERSALIIFDLDNFKEVNDTYGHDAGDKLLINIANIMRTIFRKSDVLARLGGDEFIIFIDANENMDFIKSRAERLIKEVKSIKFKKKSIVGCSIGVALGTKEDNFNSLYKKADSALYESKNKGKGCATFYKNK